MHYFAKSTCLLKHQKSILHVRITELSKKVTQAQDKENKKKWWTIPFRVPYRFVSHIHTYMNLA